MTTEDAAASADDAITSLRRAITRLEDRGTIPALHARAFDAVVEQLESAMAVLASQAATPQMFAERTD